MLGRREVLDRMLICGRRQLEKVLAEYIDHYNHANHRTAVEREDDQCDGREVRST